MVKWYPTEEAPKKHAPQKQNPTRLRGAVQPGQVLILLAGKHQGKRVVLLKQLPSGELLVTGPYKVNGVPLKRLPQSRVVVTGDFNAMLERAYSICFKHGLQGLVERGTATHKAGNQLD